MNLHQISYRLSLRLHKERDASRGVRRSTWFSFPHENRHCMWGSLLWGVTCCGLGSHHCTILQVVTAALKISATLSSQNHLACQYCWERDWNLIDTSEISESPVLLYWPMLCCLPTWAVIIKNYNSQCNLDFEVFIWMQNSRRALEKLVESLGKIKPPLSLNGRKQYDRAGLCFDKKLLYLCLKRKCGPDPNKGLHAWLDTEVGHRALWPKLPSPTAPAQVLFMSKPAKPHCTWSGPQEVPSPLTG